MKKGELMLSVIVVVLAIGLVSVPIPARMLSDFFVVNEKISFDEPPKNSFLADSFWAESHRNSYCQASSPYPGPITATNLRYRHQTMKPELPAGTP